MGARYPRGEGSLQVILQPQKHWRTTCLVGLTNQPPGTRLLQFRTRAGKASLPESPLIFLLHTPSSPLQTDRFLSLETFAPPPHTQDAGFKPGSAAALGPLNLSSGSRLVLGTATTTKESTPSGNLHSPICYPASLSPNTGSTHAPHTASHFLLESPK